MQKTFCLTGSLNGSAKVLRPYTGTTGKSTHTKEFHQKAGSVALGFTLHARLKQRRGRCSHAKPTFPKLSIRAKGLTRGVITSLHPLEMTFQSTAELLQATAGVSEVKPPKERKSRAEKFHTMFEFCCSEDSMLGQVNLERGINHVRLTK